MGGATTAAIHDYLAVRRIQPHADRDQLWLGERSCGLVADAFTARRAAELSPPASVGSGRIVCATPPPTAGSPTEARSRD